MKNSLSILLILVSTLQLSAMVSSKQAHKLIFQAPDTYFSLLKKIKGGQEICGNIYCTIRLSYLAQALVRIKSTHPSLQADSIIRYATDDSRLLGFVTCCLARAAIDGDLPSCQFLVAAGAELNAGVTFKTKNVTGTPLFFAVSNDHLEIAQFLLTAGSDPKAAAVRANCPYTPLHSAVIQENIPMIALLLSWGADLGNNFDRLDYITPLEVAVARGSQITVDLLLSHLKKNINQKNDHGVTMLVRAVYHRNVSLVRLLLAADADPTIPDATGTTALHWADDEIALLLCERGARPQANKKGKTPLHTTNSAAATELFLFKDPTLLNERTNNGKTALLRAVKRSNNNVVKVLARRGALHTPNNRGEIPLVIAASAGNGTIVRLLIDSASSDDRNLALDRVVGTHNYEIIADLLAKGAQPSIATYHRVLKQKVLTRISIHNKEADLEYLLEILGCWIFLGRLFEQVLFPREIPSEIPPSSRP
jgi:ankyrin repeat protein